MDKCTLQKLNRLLKTIDDLLFSIDVWKSAIGFHGEVSLYDNDQIHKVEINQEQFNYLKEKILNDLKAEYFKCKKEFDEL